MLIDDDDAVRELVRSHVDLLGYDLECAADGETGLERALTEEYALILLDLSPPRLGGHEVCKRLREKNPLVPVIMIGLQAEVVDKVLSLSLGADDYLAKPFGGAEICARIGAKIRIAGLMSKHAALTESGQTPPQLTYGALVIDLSRRKVSLGGVEIQLTAREFELLAFLAENPGRPMSRERILEAVWRLRGPDHNTNVNIMINRIRCKLEPDPKNPFFIRTVRGIGYRFVEQSEIG